MEFLGVLVDSKNMTLSLPQEEVEKTITQCKELLEKSLLSVRELSTLIGRLLSTTVVIPVTLQYGAFQHQQIQGINFLERHLSLLNIDADRESRDLKDSSEWKLDPQVSNKVCLAQGTPDVDLYASSVSY